MIRKLYKVCAILLIGFIGGFLSLCAFSLIPGVNIPKSDAISVANTYIVFTTIIFVGITVVLAIAGYVFTQQLGMSRQDQEASICKSLISKIATDEKVGTDLAVAMFKNSDAERHIRQVLEDKIDDLIRLRVEDLDEKAAAAERQARAVKGMASMIETD